MAIAHERDIKELENYLSLEESSVEHQDLSEDLAKVVVDRALDGTDGRTKCLVSFMSLFVPIGPFQSRETSSFSLACPEVSGPLHLADRQNLTSHEEI